MDEVCCLPPTPTISEQVRPPQTPEPTEPVIELPTESVQPTEGATIAPAAGSFAENKKGVTKAAYGLLNPLGSRSINDIAAALIKYASGIAGTLMLIYMIWGGVQYMTASDQKAVQSAQQRIVWAVIGVGVIFFAYVVIDAVIRLSSLAPGA